MNPVEKGKLKSYSLFVITFQQLRNRNQFCYLPPSGGKLREPNCRMAWAVLTIPFVLQIFLYLEYSTEIQFIQSSSTLSTLTKKKLPPRSTSCWSGIHIFNSTFFCCSQHALRNKWNWQFGSCSAPVLILISSIFVAFCTTAEIWPIYEWPWTGHATRLCMLECSVALIDQTRPRLCNIWYANLRFNDRNLLYIYRLPSDAV